MTSPRVLVTGAGGFIGLPVVRLLTGSGFEVHATSRTGAPLLERAHWHACDLRDTSATDRLLRDVRPSHLVHMAWPVIAGNWARTGHDENIAFVESTLFLIRTFASTGGTRAILAGSCTEYDWSRGRLSEDSPRHPSTFYGECKSALGDIVAAYSRALGLSHVWARIFFVYGPAEPEARLVSAIATRLLRGERAACSNGRQRRDFLFVEDVARAFALLVSSSLEGPVNIGSGHAVEVGTVIRSVAAILDRQDLVDWGALPDPFDAPLVEADGTRLTSEVPSIETVGLQEGLQATIRHLRSRINPSDV